MAGIGEFEPKGWANYLNMYSSGINDLLAVKGLTEEDVEFMEGIGPDFLKTSEKQCFLQDFCFHTFLYAIAKSEAF